MTRSPLPGPQMSAPARHHIALVGPMGAGKTTLGRRVAQMVGWPLLDNDRVLEARRGASAAEIEAGVGLDALHAAEAAALLDALAGSERAVITAAASTIDDEACRRALASRAFVVWLSAPPEAVVDAVAGSHRPRRHDTARLLADLERRLALYRAAADLHIERDSLSLGDAATRVVSAAGP